VRDSTQGVLRIFPCSRWAAFCMSWSVLIDVLICV